LARRLPFKQTARVTDETLVIDVDHDAGAPTAVVRVAGEVDIATADDLVAALDRLLVAGATDLRLDLVEVPFMDSTGLTALIGATSKLQGRGTVVVTAASASVRRTIEVAGLDRFLTFP
jgi:anti-anti-sigma factor